MQAFSNLWPKPVGDKKVTGEIEITGGKNLLLMVDELKLWALNSTLKMMIDDHHLSWVYHVIYMIIVLL